MVADVPEESCGTDMHAPLTEERSYEHSHVGRARGARAGLDLVQRTSSNTLEEYLRTQRTRALYTLVTTMIPDISKHNSAIHLSHSKNCSVYVTLANKNRFAILLS